MFSFMGIFTKCTWWKLTWIWKNAFQRLCETTKLIILRTSLQCMSLHCIWNETFNLNSLGYSLDTWILLALFRCTTSIYVTFIVTFQTNTVHGKPWRQGSFKPRYSQHMFATPTASVTYSPQTSVLPDLIDSRNKIDIQLNRDSGHLVFSVVLGIGTTFGLPGRFSKLVCSIECLSQHRSMK